MVVKNPKYYIFLKSKSLKKGGGICPPLNYFFLKVTKTLLELPLAQENQIIYLLFKQLQNTY